MLGEAAWLLLGSCLAAVGFFGRVLSWLITWLVAMCGAVVEWVWLCWCIWFVAEGELVTLASLLCCCALVCMCRVAAEWVWLCWCVWFVASGLQVSFSLSYTLDRLEGSADLVTWFAEGWFGLCW